MPSPRPRRLHLLNNLGNWLPVIALSSCARRRRRQGPRRALVGVGLGLAGGMLALGLGIALFRSIYLNAIPAEVLPTMPQPPSTHSRVVSATRPAYGAGLRPDCRSGRLPHRPLNHRGGTRAALSPGIGWLRGGADRLASAPVPSVPGYTPTTRAPDRCACPSSTGVGLLGPPDGKGDHRYNPWGVGCHGDHRVLGPPPSPTAPETTRGRELCRCRGQRRFPDCPGCRHQLASGRHTGSRCAWLRCPTTEAIAPQSGIASSPPSAPSCDPHFMPCASLRPSARARVERPDIESLRFDCERRSPRGAAGGC